MSLLNCLGRLFAPPTRDEQLYECACGAPMENTSAHTHGQGETKYRVETWTCTGPDEECLRAAQAYIFVDGSESYGKGCLTGQVTGREL